MYESLYMFKFKWWVSYMAIMYPIKLLLMTTANKLLKK
uniref:Uncharacterized protein n=1 Tax=Dreissena rostriformis TaxID=205083 RepID=A0A894JHT1_9BIVA|nr:hypothetical protein K8L31_mgp09 [Dreissena rostriformis]QRV59733.1 hypothetical protein [Dreissena rostriformis]